MKSKGQLSMNFIISMIIVLLMFVVVALPVISDAVSDATDRTTVTNEAINATNGTTQTLSNSNGNDLQAETETVFEGSTTLTRGSNYTVDNDAMTITFTNVNNSEFNASASLVNYTFQNEAFIDSATSRTVLDILPIFVALGALVAATAFILFNRS